MSKGANLLCYIPGPNLLPFKKCFPDAILDGIIFHFYYVTLNQNGMKPSHFTSITHAYNKMLNVWYIHATLVKGISSWTRTWTSTSKSCQLQAMAGSCRQANWPIDDQPTWSSTKLPPNHELDTVSNYPRIIFLNSKTAEHAAQQFENSWLSPYPCLVRCIYDQGAKFIWKNCIIQDWQMHWAPFTTE